MRAKFPWPFWKYNPYHERTTGRFASAPGGSIIAPLAPVSKPKSLKPLAGNPYSSLADVRVGHEVTGADGRVTGMVVGKNPTTGEIEVLLPQGESLKVFSPYLLTPTGATWNHPLPGGVADPTKVPIGSKAIYYANDGRRVAVVVEDTAPKGYALREIGTGRAFSESGKKLAYVGDEQRVTGHVEAEAARRASVALPLNTGGTRPGAGEPYTDNRQVKIGDLVTTPDGRAILDGFDPVVGKYRAFVYETQGNTGTAAHYAVDDLRFVARVDDPRKGKPPKTFVPAETVAEAEAWARQHAAHDVNYHGLSIEAANQVNHALYETIVKPGRRPVNVIHTAGEGGGPVSGFGNAVADATSGIERVRLFPHVWAAGPFAELRAINLERRRKQSGELEEYVQSRIREVEQALSERVGTLRSLYPNLSLDDMAVQDGRVRELVNRQASLARAFVPDRDVTSRNVEDVVHHELGHVFHFRVLANRGADAFDKLSEDFGATRTRDGQRSEAMTPATRIAAKRISEYAASKPMEHLAEAFALYASGRRSELPPRAIAAIERMLREAEAE